MIIANLLRKRGSVHHKAISPYNHASRVNGLVVTLPNSWSNKPLRNPTAYVFASSRSPGRSNYTCKGLEHVPITWDQIPSEITHTHARMHTHTHTHTHTHGSILHGHNDTSLTEVGVIGRSLNQH